MTSRQNNFFKYEATVDDWLENNRKRCTYWRLWNVLLYQNVNVSHYGKENEEKENQWFVNSGVTKYM